MERYKDFITAWYECQTLAQFCARIGMDRRTASNLAVNLRRNGVPLPAMPAGKISKAWGGRGSIDWHALRTWAGIEAGRADARKYREAV